MSLLQRIVHPVWTRLPARMRQDLYERLTIAVAPKASTHRPGPWPLPVLLAGPLGAPSGLGASARLLLEGLLAVGVPVAAIDLARPLMQQAIVPLPPLPMARPGPGTLLLAVQPPNVGRALLAIDRNLLRGKHRVGYWMWELELLPPTWRRSLALVDEVAAPSRFAAKSLAGGLGVPVRVLGLPLAARPEPAPSPRPRHRPFTFGAGFDLGSTTARKNPFAVVGAFTRAFTPSEPVQLLLKVRGEGADPQASDRLKAIAEASDGRIRLLVGDLDAGGMAAWWDSIDVLVSLHRSEGFGLLPAEAMLRGIPVIATDWSATAEFVTAETGWPVPARLVPAIDETGRYAIPGARWADPDEAAAAAALRAAYAEDGEARARRSSMARRTIQEQFGVARFAQELGIPDVGPT